MKVILVTREVVEQAADIARIVGSADELPYGPLASVEVCRCITLKRIGDRKHDCECCTHRVTPGDPETKHDHDGTEPYDCVAYAIGAGPDALRLYHRMCGALWFDSDLLEDLTAENPRAAREWLAWRESIGAPVFESGEWTADNEDLEVAALLDEGVLPPGWRLAPP